MTDIEIRKINPQDIIPYDLLYLADPSEEAVSDYLQRGTCYLAFYKGELIGEYVLLPTHPFTIELVNLAIKEKHQEKGYGKRLVKHAIQTARENKHKVIEVGTGNAGIGQLALYQKCGFTITGIDFHFFSKHYKEAIIENGIPCLHMIRLSMDL